MIQVLGLWFMMLFLAQPAWAIASLTIMADKSMAIPITQIAREYARQNQVSVSTAYISTSDQLEQINEGGAADLLITQRSDTIETLKLQGVVDIYSQTVVAKNRLVLAAPQSIPGDIEFSEYQMFPVGLMQKMTGGDLRIYIGSPDYLASGMFAMEAFRKMDTLQDIEPYARYVKYSPEMYSLMESGGLGVMFYTEVLQNPQLRVVDFFPENTHSPIIYQAVVVAGENMDEARRFLDFLKTMESRRIIDINGFVVD